MRVSWSAEQILDAVRGRSLHQQDWTVHGLSTRPAQTQKGDLFIALTTAEADHHQAVHEALAHGARAAIVSRQPPLVPQTLPLVFVDDTPQALLDLAHTGRARTAAQIVAVAGSTGKTTCKDMLRLMLGVFEDTYADRFDAQATDNLALALANLPADCRYGVVEVPVFSTLPARAAHPDIALIANAAPAHLARFKDSGALADSYADLFAGQSPAGLAVLPREDAAYSRLLAAARTHGLRKTLSFGKDNKADAYLCDLTPDETGTNIECVLLGAKMRLRIGAPGAHLAMDALAALLTCAALDVDFTLCAEALEYYRPFSGRQPLETLALPSGDITLIEEGVTSCPAALKAAFALLAGRKIPPHGHKIAILGDMDGLGAAAEAEHMALAETLVASGVDIVHCCGPHASSLYDALPGAMRGHRCEDIASLISHVASDIHAGDAVLLHLPSSARASLRRALTAETAAHQKAS